MQETRQLISKQSLELGSRINGYLYVDTCIVHLYRQVFYQVKEDRSGTRDCVYMSGGIDSDHLHIRAHCQVSDDHSDIQNRRRTSGLQCNIK